MRERLMDLGKWDHQARAIARESGFAFEDVRAACARSETYFLDLGDPAPGERAADLIAQAREAAPRYGFTLDAMVSHILLSYLHRVPRPRR
jgi:hypothetical protein